MMLSRSSSSSSSRRASSERTSGALSRLLSEAGVSYSDENEEHAKLLKKLWRLARNDESEFVRVGGEWTEFGFQRDDPVSDLRGGGLLALRNLVAFLDLQPVYARAIMSSRRPQEKNANADGFYPFAAAGVNVTSVLCELCQIDRAAPVLAESFDDCYALCFRLVDRIFDERNANYMDFNSVLKEAAERMRRAIEKARDSRDVARFLKVGPSSWGTCPADLKGILEKLPVVPDGNKDRAAKGVANMMMPKWRRRQFCLRAETFAWFKNDASDDDDKAEVYGEPRHVQLLARSSVRPHLSDAARFDVENVVIHDASFSSSSRRRKKTSLGKLRLKASSPADAQRWMAALLAAVRRTTSGTVAANTHEINEEDDEPSSPVLMPRSSSWISSPGFDDDDDDAAAETYYYTHQATGKTQKSLPPGWTSSSSGWSSRIDPDTGKTFYIFPPTGQVSWTLPPLSTNDGASPTSSSNATESAA